MLSLSFSLSDSLVQANSFSLATAQSVLLLGDYEMTARILKKIIKSTYNA